LLGLYIYFGPWIAVLGFILFLKAKEILMLKLLGLETMSAMDYQFLYDTKKSWATLQRKYLIPKVCCSNGNL